MHKIHLIAIQFLLTALAAMAASTGLAAEQPTQAEQQAKLIGVLRSDAAPAEKAMACKQLAVYGNQEAVPALAALLADPELASWARIALEAIPGEVADAALRGALDRLQGRLLIGVINSLGVRRDAKAVAPLVGRLSNGDIEVASAAAVALGHIGGKEAAKALQESLAAKAVALRSAAAEGCILCAERLLAQGEPGEAARLYDLVRKADVPAQRALEATRGAIVVQDRSAVSVAGGYAGPSLLTELLQSGDKQRFALGLRVSRELRGPGVTNALLAQLSAGSAVRQALLIQALADRGDAAALPALLQAAKSGPENVRCAALRALLLLGNAGCLPVLLDAAQDANEEIAQTASAVLADLPGAEVDRELAARLLSQTSGKLRPLLIDLAGQRCIAGATPALRKAADDADPQVRVAALTALVVCPN